MDLVVNRDELAALCGLPHIQQLIYLRGIRPYMDAQSGIVGIRRGISYQSLSEELYVDPHQGIKSITYSRAQLRRALAGLERAGLISLQSEPLKLILKCNLATLGYFVQNKAVINPSQQAVPSEDRQSLEKKGLYDENSTKADTGETSKAVTPLKDNNYIIFLLPQFEKFWDLYPLKKSRQKAWEAWQAINPTSELAEKINSALQQQIQFHQQQQSLGQWIAAWKYPANWLTQHCWEDEIQTDLQQEKKHAVHETHHAKQKSSRDALWESCKSGFDLESEADADGNVFDFCDYKRKSQTY